MKHSSQENSGHQAWNNFVLNQDSFNAFPAGEKRAAAISKYFMGQVNNGGLNSFLTYSYELDVKEVFEALTAVGAKKAAIELGAILNYLGAPLLRCSQDERWDLMQQL
jgi:hypothetical protein